MLAICDYIENAATLQGDQKVFYNKKYPSNTKIFYLFIFRLTCEIKCRIAMVKTAFNKKRAILLAHWTWN